MRKAKTESLFLEIDDSYETRQVLERLPGARINWLERKLYGEPDVIAAAAVRLDKTVKDLHLPPMRNLTLPGDLRPYQNQGVHRVLGILEAAGGAILADDMGLGKTRQAIEVTKVLGGVTLIFCPASVRETWRDELLKWNPAARVAVLGPITNKRHQAEWDSIANANYVVSSYDLAERAVDKVSDHQLPTTIVMDEGHVLRGRQSKRSKAVMAAAAMSKNKLLLTGTPLWDRPRDLQRVLQILFRNRFGSGWDFDFAYCGGSINEWGGMDNKGCTRSDELRLRLSFYMVRREKKNVAKDLPALTRQVQWLEPSPEATRAFQSAMREERSAGAVARALEASLEGKVEAALQLAQQAKRFLLFTYRRDHAAQMHKMLCTTYETPCVLITGALSTEQRKAQIALAQEQGHGVVATLDSLAVGVNLQGVASIGIMHCLSWEPMKTAQAEARLHRLGQTEPVQWIYLAMKESFDAIVIHTVVQKLDHWRSIMGKDSNRDLRNALDDYSGGSGPAADAVLKEIYDSL